MSVRATSMRHKKLRKRHIHKSTHIRWHKSVVRRRTGKRARRGVLKLGHAQTGRPVKKKKSTHPRKLRLKRVLKKRRAVLTHRKRRVSVHRKGYRMKRRRKATLRRVTHRRKATRRKDARRNHHKKKR